MSPAVAALTGVLVDMDGTLVDSEGYWIESEHALAAEHGGTWSDADALAVMGGDLLNTGRRLQANGVAMTPREIADELITRVVARMTEQIPWRPGAREFLAAVAAAGIPQVLVTASYRRYAETVAQALPPGTFAGIVPGDEVELGKPAPDCFLAATALLGVDRSGIVAVEDSPNGVKAGLAAGLTTVAIPFMVPIPPQSGLSRLASLTDLTVPRLRRIAAGQVIDTLGRPCV